MKKEPLQSGVIRLVKLQTEGRLRSGDLIETLRLGVCTVSHIQSTDTICVKDVTGRFFTLSGIGFKGRMVSTVNRV